MLLAVSLLALTWTPPPSQFCWAVQPFFFWPSVGGFFSFSLLSSCSCGAGRAACRFVLPFCVWVLCRHDRRCWLSTVESAMRAAWHSSSWLVEQRSRRPRNGARDFPLAATHSVARASGMKQRKGACLRYWAVPASAPVADMNRFKWQPVHCSKVAWLERLLRLVASVHATRAGGLNETRMLLRSLCRLTSA